MGWGLKVGGRVWVELEGLALHLGADSGKMGGAWVLDQGPRERRGL